MGTLNTSPGSEFKQFVHAERMCTDLHSQIAIYVLPKSVAFNMDKGRLTPNKHKSKMAAKVVSLIAVSGLFNSSFVDRKAFPYRFSAA